MARLRRFAAALCLLLPAAASPARAPRGAPQAQNHPLADLGGEVPLPDRDEARRQRRLFLVETIAGIDLTGPLGRANTES